MPYEQWLKDYKNKNDLDNIYYQSSDWDDQTLFRLQKQFAYTKEDINKYMTDLVINKKIPSERWDMMHLLQFLMISLSHYLIILNNYLHKLPIHPSMLIEKKIVTSELSYLGSEGNLLCPDESVLERIQLKPVLNEAQLSSIDHSYFNVTYLSTLYTGDLESSLNELGNRAIQAVHEGAKILVLDDTSLTHEIVMQCQFY